MDRQYKIITQTKDHKTVIAVDVAEEGEIMGYLRSPLRHKSRFIAIAQLILERQHNREMYKWEKLDAEHNNVWAMRFFVGQENDRIYCQEIFEKDDKKIVVMGALHLNKTTRKNSDREIAVIKKVSKYIYKKQETKNGKK